MDENLDADAASLPRLDTHRLHPKHHTSSLCLMRNRQLLAVIPTLQYSSVGQISAVALTGKYYIVVRVMELRPGVTTDSDDSEET